MQRIYLSETVSTKKHGQVFLDIKGYQDTLLVSFTTTPPAIATYT